MTDASRCHYLRHSQRTDRRLCIHAHGRSLHSTGTSKARQADAAFSTPRIWCTVGCRRCKHGYSECPGGRASVLQVQPDLTYQRALSGPA